MDALQEGSAALRAPLEVALAEAAKAGQWAIASRILAELERRGGVADGDVVDLDKRRR